MGNPLHEHEPAEVQVNLNPVADWMVVSVCTRHTRRFCVLLISSTHELTTLGENIVRLELLTMRAEFCDTGVASERFDVLIKRSLGLAIFNRFILARRLRAGCVGDMLTSPCPQLAGRNTSTWRYLILGISPLIEIYVYIN